MAGVNRIALALACALALTGCTASQATTPAPSATAVAVASAPPDGVLLSDLGFTNAPPGFSLPAGAAVEQRIDSPNNVTVMLTSPGAPEIIAYLRRELPAMGFTVTADANGSLLFESAGHDGAFTATGDLAALSLRTDRAS